MFCTHCGKELVDTAEICPFCGSPTSVKTRTINRTVSPAHTLSVIGFVCDGLAVFLPFLSIFFGFAFDPTIANWTAIGLSFALAITATVLTLIGFLKERKQKKCSIGLIALSTSAITLIYSVFTFINLIEVLIASFGGTI